MGNTTEEINWDEIRGFRNRIIHDYFGVDYAIIWEITSHDLDLLDKLVKKLLQG